MLKDIGLFANRGFVAWVLVASVLGYFVPSKFQWVANEWTFFGVVTVNGVIIGLGLIMFGMGMTLSRSAVTRAFSNPGWIVLGVLGQYLLMPVIAFVLSVAVGLNNILAAGVILVGCCPGGTASNVITFLSDADVPLSVSVTLVSTLLAPVLTPWLMWLYAQKLLGFVHGGVIEVPVWMLGKTIFVIVVPILLGLILKQSRWGDEPVPAIKHGFTLLSVVVISLIVAYVVSMATIGGRIQQSGVLILPVVLHNLFGLGTGYGLGRLFSLPVDATRAISIEVGMQNSGLGVALAGLIQDQLSGVHGVDSGMIALIAVPSVLFSVWHNMSGPMLATWWGKN